MPFSSILPKIILPLAVCSTLVTEKSAPKLVASQDSYENLDPELCEDLRKLRRELARKRGVPAYIIFDDATLRDLARKSPSTPGALLLVSGIAMKKQEQYGEQILEVIWRHSGEKRQK